jgi:hypothetical protein
MAGHRWITRPDVPNAWFLVDDVGNGVRQVKKHLYLGQGESYYQVSGPGYQATKHPAREEAMAAAEASLG